MMKNEVVKTHNLNQHHCLSCGTVEIKKSRKYCSIRCRQNLRQKLNTRSGLLQALNTRYATFYFSDRLIIMDVLPRGYKEIFRYTQFRTSGEKPAEDFSKMTNMLGSAWWAEEKRTTKKYLASRHVLELAKKQAVSIMSFRPKIMNIATIKNETLNCLEIDKAELRSADLKKIIKDAYRRQAKIHHPDIGGNAKIFLKLHNAYKELLQWAENPTFIRRRGFPDKWFYDGENQKWVQPIPQNREG
jgi:predicted nucleic acid-binding Zn ribbon protein